MTKKTKWIIFGAALAVLPFIFYGLQQWYYKTESGIIGLLTLILMLVSIFGLIALLTIKTKK